MNKILVSLFGLALLGTSGCISDINTGYAAQAVLTAGQAMTVSNQELQAAAKSMRAQGDAEAKVAASGNAYSQRLNRIIGKHTAVNGIPLNYKVYLTKDVNANASADGSIRVYSGLMDLMTDDEIRYVLGHEIGHVANGDTLRAFRTAYMASAARLGIASLSPTAESLSSSFLGELLEQALNARFSQSQELAADQYAVQFMKANNYDARAAVSALKKLEALSGGGGGVLASHPDPGERARRVEAML